MRNSSKRSHLLRVEIVAQLGGHTPLIRVRHVFAASVPFVHLGSGEFGQNYLGDVAR